MNDKNAHPIRALVISLLGQILYAPFYIEGLIKASGLCHLSDLNPPVLSVDVGPCPELNVTRVVGGVCTVLLGLGLTSFMAYKAGTFTTNKRSQFLTLVLLNFFFVVVLLLLPLHMLFGS